jgi:hypothetical protein
LIYTDAEAGGTTYAVFDARQVKSATANRGTFDPKSPNILESKRTAIVNRLLWERYP